MTEFAFPPVACVILAAGKGTRMKSATHKVLHPIGGRPMLLHLLATLDALAPERTVVVVGDKAEQVEAAVAGRAVTARQEPQLGTAHAALQARSALEGFAGDVLIMFGDVPLIPADALLRLRAALHGPLEPAVALLAFEARDPAAYGRVIAGPDGVIERMVEAKDATPEQLAVRTCNSGVMAVKAGHLWRLLERVDCDNAQREYYLPDVVMRAADEGLRSVAVPIDERHVIGVNSRAELAAAEAAFQAERRTTLMAGGVTMVAPETVFVSHDTVLAPDVVVEPFVVFGRGVRVAAGATVRAHSHLEGADVGEGCDVGPFARLRPGTVLGAGAKVGNFVEVKKAVLGAGAKANHLSYLGDATVGAGANIGAGTITCNYDGYFKHKTSIGEGAFIGSNSALVAPVTIGAGAIVAAGSTVTRDVAADALVLARGVQVEKPRWAAKFRAMMTARKKAG